jgi:DNA-binding transcriptional ArsR family regulator
MSSSAATHDDLGSASHTHEHAVFTPFPPLPPREVLDTARDILHALAAPVRIAIVLQLRETSRCVHELVDALNVPQPLVSQHLRILKAAGVVAGERSGREVRYRLVDHHLSHIVVAAVAHAGEDIGGLGAPPACGGERSDRGMGGTGQERWGHHPLAGDDPRTEPT